MAHKPCIAIAKVGLATAVIISATYMAFASGSQTWESFDGWRGLWWRGSRCSLEHLTTAQGREIENRDSCNLILNTCPVSGDVGLTTARTLVEEETLHKLAKVPGCCISNPCYQSTGNCQDQADRREIFTSQEWWSFTKHTLESVQESLCRVVQGHPKGCHVTRATVLPALGAPRSPPTPVHEKARSHLWPQGPLMLYGLSPRSTNRENTADVGAGPRPTRIPAGRGQTRARVRASDEVVEVASCPWLRRCARASVYAA